MEVLRTRYGGFAAMLATFVYAGMIVYYHWHVPFDKTVGYVMTICAIHIAVNRR